MLGDRTHKCFLETKKLDILEEAGSGRNNKRIRRHILSSGITAMWELLSVKYEKPFSIYGASAIQLLDKVKSMKETMSGQQAGLGFLFLYSLLTGDVKCKVLGGAGSSRSYNMMPMDLSSLSIENRSGSSGNDSHRYALLLAQYYADRHSKSLMGSVINVLCRNRQVSLRMPKFKDTRKNATSKQFNGWVDESDPRSPLSELFSKLVPAMSTLKRKGVFKFPPPPPHDELSSPPPSIEVPLVVMGEERKSIKSLQKEFPLVFFEKPELTDFGCEERTLNSIDSVTIAQLAVNCHHRLGTDVLKAEPPMHVEDSDHFKDLLAANDDRLIVLDFHATWCAPCHKIAPVFRMLSMKYPTALFLKIDVDACDDLAKEFKIESMPTLKFIRAKKQKASGLISQVLKI